MSFGTVKAAALNWAEKYTRVKDAARQIGKQGVEPDDIDIAVFPLYCESIEAENNLVAELMNHAIDAGGLREPGVPLDAGRPAETTLPYPKPENVAHFNDIKTPEDQKVRDAIIRWKNARLGYCGVFRAMKSDGKSNRNIDAETFGLFSKLVEESVALVDALNAKE